MKIFMEHTKYFAIFAQFSVMADGVANARLVCNTGGRVSGQNATRSKTDKMPQCKWCNKDTAEVLQGCNKSVTGV